MIPVFDLLIWTTALAQAINFWMLSKGKINYHLLLAVSLGFSIVGTWLALRDPQQTSVFCFVVLDLWGALTAYKGIQSQIRKGREVNG